MLKHIQILILLLFAIGTSHAQNSSEQPTTAKNSDEPSSLDIINNMLSNKGSLFFKNANKKPDANYEANQGAEETQQETEEKTDSTD